MNENDILRINFRNFFLLFSAFLFFFFFCFSSFCIKNKRFLIKKQIFCHGLVFHICCDIFFSYNGKASGTSSLIFRNPDLISHRNPKMVHQW